MDEKDSGVRILSIERLDRATLRKKKRSAEICKDYSVLQEYEVYDVGSYNSRLYEIEVDFYGRKKVFNVTCNGWWGDYDSMFRDVIDEIRLELNCILIDNIDEAGVMFREANYNVRMESSKYC